jgi:hypothetical protein
MQWLHLPAATDAMMSTIGSIYHPQCCDVDTTMGPFTSQCSMISTIGSISRPRLQYVNNGLDLPATKMGKWRKGPHNIIFQRGFDVSISLQRCCDAINTWLTVW